MRPLLLEFQQSNGDTAHVTTLSHNWWLQIKDPWCSWYCACGFEIFKTEHFWKGATVLFLESTARARRGTKQHDRRAGRAHPPVPANLAEPGEGVPVDVEGPPVGRGCKLHVMVTVG